MRQSNNQLQVTVEKSEDGFTAYMELLPGVISFGDTLTQLHTNFTQAVKEHLAFMQEDGDEIPAEFGADYELYFNPDFTQFLDYLSGIVNESYIAEKLEINRSLFSQYKSGKKPLSPHRKQIILGAFKEIGQELSSIC